ncbi:MAG: hypothetical protein NC930_02050, partial [Candidatus Omnitrophica bacterium]|nr:hypothetical protein [Candidatus Omnitrophota bacterium]
MKAGGGNYCDLETPGLPPGYVVLTQPSSGHIRFRYNLRGSKTSFVKVQIEFTGDPGDLPQDFVLAVNGPNHIRINVDVFDVEGDGARFQLVLIGEPRNYTLTLDPLEPNVDENFDRRHVSKIEFELNRDLVGYDLINYINVRTAGLDSPLEGQRYDESKLTVHTNTPRVSAAGLSEPGGLNAYITLEQMSSDEIKYMYNVRSSRSSYTVVSLSAGAFDAGGIFHGTPGVLTENFTFAARGPDQTLMRVEIEDTHHGVVSYHVRLRPGYQNYTLDLSQSAIPDTFDRGSIAAVRFIQNRGLTGKRWREIVRIKTRGLEFVPVSLPESLVEIRNFLVETGLTYFQNGVGVDPDSHFPYDSIAATGNSEKFAQPTLIGFYLQILSDIASGNLSTPSVTVDGALDEMNAVMDSLLSVQSELGWNGLIPWIDLDGTFQAMNGQVGLGDNANLAQSLAVAAGALEGASFGQSQQQKALSIVKKIENFLDQQQPGYEAFVDPTHGLFRLSYDRVQGTFNGYMDRIANEFRGAVAFLLVRYPSLPRSVWDQLKIVIRIYKDRFGRDIQNVAPWDGGAFQMFWPLLRNREDDFIGFQKVLFNHFVTQTDFAYRYNLPGFVSASQVADNLYSGRIGIPEISESGSEFVTDIGSTYALASAYSLDPQLVLQWLKYIGDQIPAIKGAYGFFDAARSKTEIARRFLGVDVASTVIGLICRKTFGFEKYLQNRDLEMRYNLFYDQTSQTLDLLTKAGRWQVAPPPAIPQRSLATFSHIQSEGTIGVFPFIVTEPYGSRFIYGELLNPSGEKFGGKFWNLDQVYDARKNKLRIRYLVIDSPIEIKIELKNERDEALFVTYREVFSGYPYREMVIDLPDTADLSTVQKVLIVIDQDRS